MSGISASEKDDVVPICPHCSEELHAIWLRKVESPLGNRYIYFCPACKKVLGVSHRKGFWMG
ncbi:MAG TPA: hypothetical protein ENI37_01720 [Chloroflexi bacterium]|nr:hypothetical protein [Chloroflexota bacterium]